MRRILWRVLIVAWVVGCGSGEYMMAGYLDNSEPSKSRLEALEPFSALARTAQLAGLDLDLDADESTIVSTSSSDADDAGLDKEGLRYAIPFPFAFNGGKPFSLEKDPITGKIDFEKAPVNAVNYTDRYQEKVHEDKEENSENDRNNDPESYIEKKKKVENEDLSPNEINPYSPNFHDFLNLPVHYSSDKYGKDKYPLISSSYANTKVQSGSNSYSTNNHRPYHRETTLYYPTRKTSLFKSPVITTTQKTRVTTTPTITTTKRISTTPSVGTDRTTVTITTTTSTTAPKQTQRPTLASTRPPAITTWKPSTTSSSTITSTTTTTTTPATVKYDNNDYDDMLPIEKLQTSVYNAHQGPSNVLPTHREEFQIRPDMGHDEEYDGYEDYDNQGDITEHDYLPMKDILKETTVKPEVQRTSVHYSDKQSTAKIPERASSTTVTEPTSPPTTSTARSPLLSYTSGAHQDNVFSPNPLQLQVLPHRTVTSMPLGDGNRESLPPHDNVVDSSLGYRPVQVLPSKKPIDGFVLESTSNIVVPPGQDTVSFVLGNRQNVEDGYYSPGLAIGESPYGNLAELNPSFKPVYNVVVNTAGEQHPVNPPETQENYEGQPPMQPHDRRGTVAVPTVIADPALVYQNWWPPVSFPLKATNDIGLTKAEVPTFAKDSVLVKQSEDDQKGTGYVVFPDLEGDREVDRHAIMLNEANDTVREILPSTAAIPATIGSVTTTMKPRVDPMPNDNLPQLSENLTPPAERPRPPYYYHYQHIGVPRPNNNREYSKPRPPLPPRGIPPYETPFSNGKPVLPPHPDSLNIRRRPPFNPDTKLPNILPQFRPNAKASHGHRGPENIGTIAAGGQPPFSTRVRQAPLHVHHPPPSRRPFPSPLSHLQRLNPPPPPIHALRLTATPSSKVDNMLPPLQSELETQRFRLPSGRDNGDDVAKSAVHPGQQKLRQEEEEDGERYSEEPPQLPPRPPLFPKRRTADPPRVATLQMIQQRGEPEEESDSVELAKDVIEGESSETLKNDFRNAMIDPPVYVVYPVNSAVNIHSDDFRDKDETVVVGTRGPHRPLPPDTLLQGNEYEKLENDGPMMNPSIDRRVEALALNPSADRRIEEPLIGASEQSSLTAELPYPVKRLDGDSLIFSGTRETPLLIPSDQRENAVVEKNLDGDGGTSVNVIPYLQDFVPFPTRKNGNAISSTLHRAPSSTPIAYVYTPSVQMSHQLDEDVSRLDDKKDEKPVLLPSQQPSSSSSSAPSPQNFMAPFVASVSAETPVKNGWSVVVVEPSIDRSSSVAEDEQDESPASNGDNEMQTERAEFDLDNFKPQLFGGFKPIYEFPSDDTEQADRSQMGTADVDAPRHGSNDNASSAA